MKKNTFLFSSVFKKNDIFPTNSDLFYDEISLYFLAPDYIIRFLENTVDRIFKVLFNSIPKNILGIITLKSLAKFIDLWWNYFKHELKSIQNINYNLRNIHFIVQRHSNYYGKLVSENKIPELLNSLPGKLQSLQNKNQVRKRNFYTGIDLSKHKKCTCYNCFENT